METVELSIGGNRVIIAGICEGLEGEADAVADLVRQLQPAVVALGIDGASVAEATGWTPSEDLEGEDALYSELLSTWGTVRLPPAAYGVAVQIAESQGADVVGVDLAEGHYVDLFTEGVSIWELFKRTRRLRKLKKRPPQASSPEALCRTFDARMNKDAFAELEARREEHLAKQLTTLCSRGTVLAVVPVARLDGLTRRVRGPEPGSPDP